MVVEVEINNVGFGYGEPWIVARYSRETKSFWYYGRYEKRERAELIAREIDGVVLKEVEQR